jgi:hypothetical protein
MNTSAFSVANALQGRSAPKYLHQFEAEPDQFIHDLLTGRADIGHQAGLSPSDLLGRLLYWLDEENGFHAALDEALSKWTNTQWGKTELPNVKHPIPLISGAWCQCVILAREKTMAKTADSLHKNMGKDPVFLDSYAVGDRVILMHRHFLPLLLIRKIIRCCRFGGICVNCRWNNHGIVDHAVLQVCGAYLPEAKYRNICP